MTGTRIAGDGALLLNWMRLLGWTVELEWTGTGWVGSARRSGANGEEARFEVSEGTYGGAISELFCTAFRDVELLAA